MSRTRLAEGVPLIDLFRAACGMPAAPPRHSPLAFRVPATHGPGVSVGKFGLYVLGVRQDTGNHGVHIAFCPPRSDSGPDRHPLRQPAADNHAARGMRPTACGTLIWQLQRRHNEPDRSDIDS